MKAWKLTEAKKLQLETIDETEGQNGLVKVKIARAALSSSDISSFLSNEKEKFIPSRTALGLISEAFGETYKKGERVLLSPYPNKVADGEDLRVKSVDCDGYLCDFTYVDQEYIYALPDGIADEAVEFVEDIALASKVYSKLNIESSQYVLIYGCSATSLILAQLCIYYQAIPIVVDSSQERLAIASELGIYYTLDQSKEDISLAIKEITSGNFADFLIVDTDAFPYVNDTLSYVGKNGKVGLIGFNKNISQLKGDFAPVINLGLTVYGVNDGFGEIASAINFLATQTVHVEKLIANVVAFDDVPNAILELSGKQNCFKTIVKC
ncbi:MAG: zinc-binding dehydrogenase [Clostridia bacterium]